MALCPAGHESQTNDYCDTCGALMGGAPVTPAAELASTAVLPTEGGPQSSAGGSCPQCGADRDGRFCEECGFDYELAALVPPGTAFPTTVAPSTGSANTGPSSAGSVGAGASTNASAATGASAASSADPLAETSALPPDYDLDAEFEAAERAFAESGGVSATPASTGSAEPAAESAAATSSAPALVVLVTADQEYYTAQVERGDIVEDEFPFPRYPGERRFALEADRVRIGRASASRGIAVEIDLTGPPLDPAVSHLHAQLLRSPDGSWALVDLNSANGTRLNGAADPLPAETEVPVKAGDRIHLGVWTTLTLEEA
jgi:hypothetical protein